MNELKDLPRELLSSKIDYDLSEEIVVVNATEDESPMDEQAVHYFIDEVLKKKKELHDPRHRCNRFFGEIRNILFVQYGLFYSVKTLERKYHYLKRQFDAVCKNKNRSSTWIFFNKMMEIFAEELDIEDAPTMASLYPDLPLPKSALPLPPKPPRNQERIVRVPPPTEETTWEHAVVLDFLNECVQMRDAFWDPSHGRRDILIELQKRMKDKGYTFEQDTLDRRLRNLKCCYHGTVATMKKKGIPLKGLRHPWPYFEQMHTLYDGYIENKDLINKKRRRKGLKNAAGGGVGRKRAVSKTRTRFANKRLTSALGTSKMYRLRPRRCKPEFIDDAPKISESNSEEQQILEESFVDVNCSFSPGDLDGHEQEEESRVDDNFETEIKINPETADDDDDTKDFEFAQKMLSLEERRTIATEKLLDELKESNRIRQRKVQFNQMKLSYLRARAKRKEFV